jgi:hypothetical protein
MMMRQPLEAVWSHFLIARPVIGKYDYLLMINGLIEVQGHPANPIKFYLMMPKDIIVMIRRHRLCYPATEIYHVASRASHQVLIQRGVVLPHITVVVMLLMIDAQAAHWGPLLCRLRLVGRSHLIH